MTTKRSDLFDAVTAVADTDTLMVNDLGAVALKNITAANFLRLGYGNITVAGNAATTALTATTWTDIPVFDTNGLSIQCTNDQANNRITVTNTGVYVALISATVEIPTAETHFEIQPYWNTGLVGVPAEQFVSIDGNRGTALAFALVNVTTGSTHFKAQIRSDATHSVTITEANLLVVRLS